MSPPIPLTPLVPVRAPPAPPAPAALWHSQLTRSGADLPRSQLSREAESGSEGSRRAFTIPGSGARDGITPEARHRITLKPHMASIWRRRSSRPGICSRCWTYQRRRTWPTYPASIAVRSIRLPRLSVRTRARLFVPPPAPRPPPTLFFTIDPPPRPTRLGHRPRSAHRRHSCVGPGRRWRQGCVRSVAAGVRAVPETREDADRRRRGRVCPRRVGPRLRACGHPGAHRRGQCGP